MPKTKRGRRLYQWRGVNLLLRQKCTRLGIPPVSPNDLRRTFASWLIEGGTPQKAVSRMLGHKTTAMVDRVYGHVELEHFRGDVDRLGQP